jgi:hypothetical protein
MQKDSIEYIKQLIREEGGYVSCVEPMGPVTVIFCKCHDPMYETKGGEKILLPSPQHERTCLELPCYVFDELEDIRQEIKDRLSISKLYGTMNPIFSVYQVFKLNGKFHIRMGVVDHMYGKTTTEVTYEEAEELLKNPPNYPHPMHWIDMKTIYKL